MNRRVRDAVALTAGMTVALAVSVVPGAAPASAASDASDLITTASTKTVAWKDQEHNSLDLGASANFSALKDLTLRVSQTQDLLNQTVQVTWRGVKADDVGAMSFMQCWSDGPDIAPTREQCAYGGVAPEDASATGAARTRALGRDPRESTYRADGDLAVATVAGAAPPKTLTTWTPTDAIEFGNVFGQTCAKGTDSWSVNVIPPRAAIAAGTVPPSLPAGAPTAGVPGTLPVKIGAFDRTYTAVTPAIVFGALPGAPLPVGQYRIELDCRSAGGGLLTRLVGFVQQVEKDGARVWRNPSHVGGVSVAFDPLGSTPETAPTDPFEEDQILEYLKPRSTNELADAATRVGGTGEVFMEMLTDLEAQHLGCGRVDAGKARSCWLVAVPRTKKQPDGRDFIASEGTSPLSESRWDLRLQVPLGFAPVASGCKIGSGLKQILSHDSALSVLRSWQPTFCADSNTASSVLGPLQDFSIRAGIGQPNRMGVMTTPEPGVPTDVIAPIATSSVVVAFSVNRRLGLGSDQYNALNGTRATLMNLTPRLLAKLLTQSYDSGAAPNGASTVGYNTATRGGIEVAFTPARNFPAGNPRTMYDDKEFLSLNPDFASWLAESAGLRPQDMADLLVATNDTDAYQVLWRYVAKDPKAKAFLGGEPDENGMRINPYYKEQVTSETSSFPLFDPTCVDEVVQAGGENFPLLCQVNVHPRAENDTDAARALVRADSRRSTVVPTQITGAVGDLSYKAQPRQTAGEVALMCITTSAIAERYGLPVARLQNSDGAFISPTAASMALARDQMASRDDGVLLTEPESVGGDGYPLTTNSYAVVDVSATTQQQNDAFAKVLAYAAGAGQKPGTAIGQLPPGYAPLSRELSAQTAKSATLLKDPSALLPVEEPEVPAPPKASAPDVVATSPTVVATDPMALAPVVTPRQPLGQPQTPQVVASPAPTATPAPVLLTARATTQVGWAIPSLVLLALAAGLAGRVLRLVTGPPR